MSKFFWNTQRYAGVGGRGARSQQLASEMWTWPWPWWTLATVCIWRHWKKSICCTCMSFFVLLMCTCTRWKTYSQCWSQPSRILALISLDFEFAKLLWGFKWVQGLFKKNHWILLAIAFWQTICQDCGGVAEAVDQEMRNVLGMKIDPLSANSGHIDMRCRHDLRANL